QLRVSKDGGAPSDVASPYASGETTNLANIRIGQKDKSSTNFTLWRGRVAEVFVFTVSDNTEFLALLEELKTKKPDACDNGTLRWYAPLLDDATVEVGASLTNNGSVAFDDTDHPSLSGGPALSVPDAPTNVTVTRNSNSV